jgi:hypothetical protein
MFVALYSQWATYQKFAICTGSAHLLVYIPRLHLITHRIEQAEYCVIFAIYMESCRLSSGLLGNQGWASPNRDYVYKMTAWGKRGLRKTRE